MTRGTSSPSLDGKSTKFFVGGSTPYSHGLWWKRLGDGESGSRNLVLDIYYYLKTPSASGGLEFNANQSVGGKRYQFSVQCSYILKIWQVWDTYNGRWSKTAAPCTLAPAYKWQHVVFEFQRTSENKARFISINVDGKKMYIDKRFSPKGTSATSLGIHFQLNGNKYQTDYSAWVDKLKLTTF
jgi:hypothetical protein